MLRVGDPNIYENSKNKSTGTFKEIKNEKQYGAQRKSKMIPNHSKQGWTTNQVLEGPKWGPDPKMGSEQGTKPSQTPLEKGFEKHRSDASHKARAVGSPIAPCGAVGSPNLFAHHDEA